MSGPSLQSDARPTVVQLKMAAKLLTVIGSKPVSMQTVVAVYILCYIQYVLVTNDHFSWTDSEKSDPTYNFIEFIDSVIHKIPVPIGLEAKAVFNPLLKHLESTFIDIWTT